MAFFKADNHPYPIEESRDGTYVVRLYDGFDHGWCDITKSVSLDEALRVWRQETKNGTEYTRFEHIDYFRIFPADTRMLFDLHISS
jgi:hypothetical protein